jgi:hypothetical protein
MHECLHWIPKSMLRKLIIINALIWIEVVYTPTMCSYMGIRPYVGVCRVLIYGHIPGKRRL